MESVLPGSRFDLDAIFGDWGWTAPQSLVISLLARCAKVPASRTTSRCLSIPKCDVRPSPRQPVVAVARKKKELVGNFKDAGREWHPAGQPERVQVHDFRLPYARMSLTLRGTPRNTISSAAPSVP